jgi:hypothetical protein
MKASAAAMPFLLYPVRPWGARNFWSTQAGKYRIMPFHELSLAVDELG